ncbi:MAG: phosphoenolpyruvate synthase [Candidatus Aenigmatarchaeota archaeon]
MPFVVSAEGISKGNVREVGGKAANLAEMINIKLPVPPAFFITVESFQRFIDENNLRHAIAEIIKKVDFSDVNSLAAASENIKNMVVSGKMPGQIRNAITKAYQNMSYLKDEKVISALDFIKGTQQLPFVAVRSSSVLEDAEKTSAAGQYESYLNIRGVESLMLHVIKCWASTFTPRAIYYRHKNGQPQDAGIGVIVQSMVNAERSGVAFTVDPINPADEGANRIIIEACWGLGETIVQGQVEPDRYAVDKRNGELVEKFVGNKTMMRRRDPASGATVMTKVPKDLVSYQVLNDTEIKALAAICKRIEDHYGRPQDIEWAAERGKLFILQTRAVTYLQKAEKRAEIAGEPLISGYGVSPGIGRGAVRIIHSLNELGKIAKGDVLVTEMTSPDYVPAMEKSAAIVTNQGGSTCHAAIVSRELGIPCIVGTKNATEILKDGQFITVDATHGKVYAGNVEEYRSVAAAPSPSAEAPQARSATKIKVNLAFPETAERAKHADGVGLLRLEHMLTRAGMHPMEYVRQNRVDELMGIIIQGVGKVAKAFFPKPVWVRSLDVRTDEFRNMEGGSNEPREDNPMLGWHGIRRSLDEPDILRAEFRAVKNLHELGLTNVAIMMPFVIDVSELRKAKAIATEVGLPETVKFGIMVETPAAALTIEEFCMEGIQFASFGSNDLTQTTLGIDRNNERLIGMFNEMHGSMRFLFKHVIDACKKYGVESSICGELPSNREDAVEFLVGAGIDSLSVNIDAIDKVREWAARSEKKARGEA